MHALVNKVENRRRAVRAKKINDEVVVDYEDTGWFVTIRDGADQMPPISFVVGSRPDLEVGDRVRVTIEKVLTQES